MKCFCLYILWICFINQTAMADMVNPATSPFKWQVRIVDNNELREYGGSEINQILGMNSDFTFKILNKAVGLKCKMEFSKKYYEIEHFSPIYLERMSIYCIKSNWLSGRLTFSTKDAICQYGKDKKSIKSDKTELNIFESITKGLDIIIECGAR